MRKQPARLVVPSLAIQHEEMRLHGLETPRDRALAIQRQKRADADAATPAIIEGEIESLTAIENVMTYMERRGLIVNKTTRGGRYGDILYNAILVNPVTPIFTHLPQTSADTASTTNTASTVAAGAKDIVLPDGIWSVLMVCSLEMQRSVVGSSRIAGEIDGTESLSGAFLLPFTSGTNSTHTTVWSRKAWGILLEDVAGAQTITGRVRYRSDTSGTTSAQNPHIMMYTWRVA